MRFSPSREPAGNGSAAVPSPRSRRIAGLIAALAASLALGACSSTQTASDLTSMFKPYRAPVIQGNFVSREMAAELKPGMSKEQVQSILGTPLLDTVFNGERWEYVFSLREGYKPPIVRRFSVYFDKDGHMTRTDGDPLPSEEEFVAQISSLRSGGKPKTLSEEQLQKEIAAAQKDRGTTKQPVENASQPNPLTLIAPQAEIAALQKDAPPTAASAPANGL